MRPRSWWSWESPKRSASRIIIMVAWGTSIPTSTTVVHTNSGVLPEAKSDMTRCFVAASRAECSCAMGMSAKSGKPCSRAAVSSTECKTRSSLRSSSCSESQDIEFSDWPDGRADASSSPLSAEILGQST